MKIEHTPFPWTVEPSKDLYGHYLIAEARREQETWVDEACARAMDDGITDEEQKAADQEAERRQRVADRRDEGNCRMIEAIPRLLEAAAAACTALCDLRAGYPEAELHEPVTRTIDRLRGLLRELGVDDEGAWVEPAAKWYAISGRFLFDDEDSCHAFQAASYAEAAELWEAAMREDDPDNENDLLVTMVMESDTEIEVSIRT
jgi:hypothetical protein